jgi:hypothetical protein
MTQCKYHRRNTSTAPLRDAENATLGTLDIKSVVEQNTQNCVCRLTRIKYSTDLEYAIWIRGRLSRLCNMGNENNSPLEVLRSFVCSTEDIKGITLVVPCKSEFV